MRNLIRLELKKQKFKGSPLGFAIATAAVCLMVGLTFSESLFSGAVPSVGYMELFTSTDTFVRATFLIYGAVLLAKFVIDEYKNKTISHLFTFPVDRKKLIGAKLIIVGVWLFLAILLANVLIVSVMLLLDLNLQAFAGTLDGALLAEHAVRMVANAVAAVGIVQIPLAIGVWRKSVPATIVTAVVLTLALNASNEGFTLTSILYVPLGFAAFGLLLTALTLRGIDRADVV